MGEVRSSRWRSNQSMGKFGAGMYVGELGIVDIGARASMTGDDS
jgi:hypothetical protein